MKTNTLLPLVGLLAITALLTAFSAQKTVKRNPEITFQDFIAQFPAQSLPYALDEKSLRNNLDAYIRQLNGSGDHESIAHTARLDWDYFKFLPEMENQAMFSRLPLQVEPIASFASADRVAVLYGASRGSRLAFSVYHITLFDKSGQFISSNIVGQVMPDKIHAALISPDFQVTTQIWTIQWQKNYEKTSIAENKIKGLKLTDTALIDLTVPTPKPAGRMKELLSPEVEKVSTPLEGVKTK